MTRLPERADVEAAAARIRSRIRETPSLAAGTEVSGVANAVTLKLDGLQYSGSFKARGAFNALLAEPVPPAGVVAASGGNHGAAVAYAARALGHAAAIFVPRTAPPVKIARLRGYGADVHLAGDIYAEAYEAARAHQGRTGARLLHAFDDFAVVAGQGTAALELERQTPGGLDTVIVAVGGGGLLGGTIACLAKRGVRVVAVESTGTPTLARALEAGQPIQVAVGGLAADALGASLIGEHGFALAQAHLRAMVLVEDDEIRAAQRRLWHELRVIAEPGGAAAFAALSSGRYRPAAGERVGIIVCGANADLGSFPD